MIACGFDRLGASRKPARNTVRNPGTMGAERGYMSFGRLEQELLFSQSQADDDSSNFDAVLGAHGTYNTLKFVLRLSPRIHRLLSTRPAGIYSSGEIGFEHAQAFSTLLHETVHW